MRKGTNEKREAGDREVYWVEDNQLSSVSGRKTGCLVVF
jgi:hypothetical protein